MNNYVNYPNRSELKLTYYKEDSFNVMIQRTKYWDVGVGFATLEKAYEEYVPDIINDHHSLTVEVIDYIMSDTVKDIESLGNDPAYKDLRNKLMQVNLYLEEDRSLLRQEGKDLKVQAIENKVAGRFKGWD